MTFVVDVASDAVCVDDLDAGFAWLRSFMPAGATLADLDRAIVMASRVRSFADAISLYAGAERDRLLVATKVPASRCAQPSGVAKPSAAEQKRQKHAARAASAAPDFVGAVEDQSISFDHLAALGRARNMDAVPAAAKELLDAAKRNNADDFAKIVRRWDTRTDHAKGIDRAARQRNLRNYTSYVDDDGMGVTKVTLEPFRHEQVQDAVRRKAEQIFREGGDTSSTLAQRLADAFVALITGARPEATCVARTTMMVIINEHDLYGRLEDAGVATVIGGEPITATQARQMACNAGIIPVVLGGDGEILDLGRKTRTASAAQWKALWARDGGCVIQGCNAKPAWCEAHHGVTWQHRGPTDLNNLWLFCTNHHTQHHQHHWTGHVEGGKVHLTDKFGNPIPTRDRAGPAG
jgi:Domain of unknown function (DUF222)